MDVKTEKDHNLLCKACLCTGRRLKSIFDDRCMKYYLHAVSEIPLPLSLPATIDLCWECDALLRKCVLFREQIKDCYRIWATYTSESVNEFLTTDISRPSSLKVESTPPVDIKPEFELVTHDVNEDKLSRVQAVFVKDEEESWTGERADLKDEFILLPSEKDRKTAKDESISRLENKNHVLNGSDEDCYDETKSIGSNENDLKTELNLETEIEERKLNFQPSKSNKKNTQRIRKRKKLGEKLENDSKISAKTETKIKSIELTYEEMLAERAQQLTALTGCQFKCDSCLIGFARNDSFQHHMKSKHDSSIGDYICPVCKTVLCTIESYTTHTKRHLKRYECSACGKRCMDRRVIQNHYNLTHETKVKEYKCEQCGKISNSIDAHRYHKDSHNARVECSQCDKTFSHRTGLMNHIVAVHKQNNTHLCSVCGRNFRWKTSLRKHMEIHERKSKAVAFCTSCDVSFTSVCSYKRHLRNSLKHVTQNHHKFICDHCQSRFSNKTKLRDHIEEKHLHRTYSCHICLKPSKNRVCLDQHIRNVHKGRPNNKMCHHCGKGFPTKIQLESHIRSHTGERPFICEFCPTTFSQQSNLYKHNRQVHMHIKSKRYRKKSTTEVKTSSTVTDHPYTEVSITQGFDTPVTL